MSESARIARWQSHMTQSLTDSACCLSSPSFHQGVEEGWGLISQTRVGALNTVNSSPLGPRRPAYT